MEKIQNFLLAPVRTISAFDRFGHQISQVSHYTLFTQFLFGQNRDFPFFEVKEIGNASIR